MSKNRLPLLSFMSMTLVGAALAVTLPSKRIADGLAVQSPNAIPKQGVTPPATPLARRTAIQQEYQDDIDRLEGLRSHSLDELTATANQLESKWRGRDWNLYALIMMQMCSEISNRGLSDARVRSNTEKYARVALSHNDKLSWERESALVGWLPYERLSSSGAAWRRERGENAKLWLQVWQRLERETDPGFDINDPRNRPLLRVIPPDETRLSPGSPPSAIKDSKLRARYEAAIAANDRKAERARQQISLLSNGPSFKTRAERWLIMAYSQRPFRNAELKWFLKIYVSDAKARKRILNEVDENTK